MHAARMAAGLETWVMALGELLAGIYARIEDGWNDAFDFLENLGLPLSGYRSTLEERGLPSLPFTIFVIVVLFLIYLFFIGQSGVDLVLTLDVRDDTGTPIREGVSLQVFNDKGELVLPVPATGHGKTLSFDNVPRNTQLVVEASRTGYSSARTNVFASQGEEQLVTLKLKRDAECSNATWRFVDAESGAPVKQVAVTAVANGVPHTGSVDGKGIVSFACLPKESEVKLVVRSDAYEEWQEVVRLDSDRLLSRELTPKPQALEGPAELLVRVTDPARNNEPIQDVNIQIMGRIEGSEAEQLLNDGQTLSTTGEATYLLEKGTVVRVVVEKEGYLTNDQEAGTLREAQKVVNIELIRGGEKLTITPLKEFLGGESVINDVQVNVYDADGKLIASQNTGQQGFVSVAGLSTETQYFVTLYHPDYLPARAPYIVDPQGVLDVSMQEWEEGQAATLVVQAEDQGGAALGHARVVVFKEADGVKIPIGHPETLTALDGTAELTLPVGETYSLEVVLGAQRYFASDITITPGTNEVNATLSVAPDPFTLLVQDAEGTAIEAGTVTVIAQDGTVLFEGDLLDCTGFPDACGKAVFDAKGQGVLDVSVTLPDGSQVREQIERASNEEYAFQVDTDAEAPGAFPSVTFEGVFDVSGSQVEALARGRTYFLRFGLKYPTAADAGGGLHVRVGQDAFDAPWAEGQGVAIFGYRAVGGEARFGKSYQPGLRELVDKQNLVGGGQRAKWFEIRYGTTFETPDAPPPEPPADTETVMVRIAVDTDSTLQEVKLHYRAWVEVGGKFFRTPKDEVLGLDRFNSAKDALYAQATTVNIPVLAHKPVCSHNVCAAYSFLKPRGLLVKPEGFQATVGEVYGLQVELRALEESEVALNLATGRPEKAMLLAPTGEPGTCLASPPPPETGGFIQELSVPVPALAEGTTEFRCFYFLALERTVAPDKALLNASVDVGTAAKEKELRFDITAEHVLSIQLDDTIPVGEDTVLRVHDGEGSPVDNAQINVTYRAGGQTFHDAFPTGTPGTEGNGLNGEYFLPTSSYVAGLHPFTVHVDGFADVQGTLVISEEDVLPVPDKMGVHIKQGETRATVRLPLNNTSVLDVSEISVHAEQDLDFPTSLTFSARTSSQRIPGKTEAELILEATYDGDAEERVYGDASLVLEALLGDAALLRREARVQVTYNRALDDACLGEDQKELAAYVSGKAGSSSPVSFSLHNSCGEDLHLNVAVALAPGEEDSGLSIEPAEQSLLIKDGENADIAFTLKHDREQIYAGNVNRVFNVALTSPQLQKEIKLTATLRDPSLTLQTNNNIFLWLSKEETRELMTGIAPLVLRNLSGGDIFDLSYKVRTAPEDIRIAVIPTTDFPYYLRDAVSPYIPAGTDVDLAGPQGRRVPAGDLEPAGSTFLPEGALETSLPTPNPYTAFLGRYGWEEQHKLVDRLEPHAFVEPPKTLYAVSERVEGLGKGPHLAQIDLSGTLNGSARMLKTVNVWINVDESACLALSVPGGVKLHFASASQTGVVLTQTVLLKNNCRETVKVLSTAPRSAGINELSITPTLDLGFGEQAPFDIVLNLKEPFSNVTRPTDFAVTGLLVTSQRSVKSNTVPLTIEGGTGGAEVAGVASPPVSIGICESPGQEKEIRFPRISKGDDCAEGYCDARQAARYLLAHAQGALTAAQFRVQEAGFKTENTPGCREENLFCTFEQLGVKSPEVPLFLRNDRLGKELMEFELAAGAAPELSGYMVNIDLPDLEALDSFNQQQIYLSTPLEGCGQYLFQVDGAIRNLEGTLDASKNVLRINVIQERLLTPECLNKIQNASNFLPVDSGLFIGNRQGTWAAGIIPEGDIRELGMSFGEVLFNDQERLLQESGTTSAIALSIGSIPEEPGSLLRVSVDSLTSSTGAPAPKKVNVQIRLGEETGSPEQRRILAERAAKALFEFSKQVEGVELCIDNAEQHLVFRSFSPLGEIAITGPNRMEVVPGRTCIDLKVESDSDDKVELKSDWKTLQEQGRGDGVQEAFLKYAGTKVAEYGAGAAGTHVPLTPNPAGPNSAPFQLCIDGDPANLGRAGGKVLNLKARSAVLGGGQESVTRESPPHPVTLEVCGVHPFSLVKRMKEADVPPGSKDTFYATVGWKGEPEPSVSLRSIDAALRVSEFLEQPPEGPTVVNPFEPNPVELTGERLTSYWGLCLPACAAVTTVCSSISIFGFVGGLFNAAINCVPPVALATFGGGGGTSNAFYKTMEGIFGPQALELQREVEGTVEDVVEGTGADAFIKPATLEEFEDNLLGPATVTVALGGLQGMVHSFRAAGRPISDAPEVSQRLAKEIAGDMRTNQLAGAANPAAADNVANAFEKELATSLDDEISRSGKATIGEAVADPAVEQRALTRAGRESADEIVQAGKGLDGSPLGTRAATAYDDAVSKSFGRAGSEGADEAMGQQPRNVDPNNPAALKNSTDDLAEELSESTLRNANLDDLPPAERAQLEKNVQKKLAGAADDGVITPAEGRGAVVDAVDDMRARPEFNDYMRGQVVDDVGSNAARPALVDAVDDAGRKAQRKGIVERGRARIGQGGAKLFGAIKGLGLGLACDVAGWAACLATVQYFAKREAVLDAGEEDALQLVDGKLTGDEEIFKFVTYKIDIETTEDGVRNYHLTPLRTPAQFEALRRVYEKNPEKVWKDDCGAFADKGLEGLLGHMAPEITQNHKEHHVLAYYQNQGAFARAENELQVPEYLLMGMMITRPEHISGVRGCTVSPQWWEHTAASRAEMIRCAAETFVERAERTRAQNPGISEDSLEKTALEEMASLPTVRPAGCTEEICTQKEWRRAVRVQKELWKEFYQQR